MLRLRRMTMKQIPRVGIIRERRTKDFAEPVTAGLFVSIAAWAGEQREEDETPYWRTLKAGGELNPQYPGGAEAQKAKLEAEGRTVLQRGRTHIRYVVADYQDVLFTLE